MKIILIISLVFLSSLISLSAVDNTEENLKVAIKQMAKDFESDDPLIVKELIIKYLNPKNFEGKEFQGERFDKLVEKFIKGKRDKLIEALLGALTGNAKISDDKLTYKYKLEKKDISFIYHPTLKTFYIND
jgi:ABC-type oligopeptide transport system substrate-binding subunit